MKNILLAKPKIAHHPLLRSKLWQDKKKKKKNDDHNLTAVLRREVAGKSRSASTVVPTGLWRTITVKLWSAFMILVHCSLLAPLSLRRTALHQSAGLSLSYLISEMIDLSPEQSRRQE